MAGLKYLTVTLVGAEYDDHDYVEPVRESLFELSGSTSFRLGIQGESQIGNETARLESLTERSDTLRTILAKVTSEGNGIKRKAEDLDWGPPAPVKRRKGRKRSRVY